MAGHRVNRQEYKRACDICGHPWPFYKLKYIGEQLWGCPDDFQGLTASQLARHQARLPPLRVRPRPHAKLQGETPMYQGAEGQVFNLVNQFALKAASVGPTGAITAANTGTTAADCGLYLATLIAENMRPAQWMTTATATLLSIGAYLLTQQYGSLTGPSPAEATSSILYGGVQASTGVLGTVVTSQAGLAFLQLSAMTSDPQWLAAADRCAWYLRQIQRADALTAGFTADTGGNRLRVGAWAPALTVAGKVVQAVFVTLAAFCLWFAARYRDVRGASFALGTATASGDFTIPPAGTAQSMIDEAVAFYLVGTFPYKKSLPGNIAPLSTTTPQQSATFTTANYFTNLTTGGFSGISGLQFAQALRGAFENEGYTTRIAAIFEWLMSFTANASFVTPANTPLSEVAKGLTGAFDPIIAPPDFLGLAVGAAVEFPTVKTNATSRYSTQAAALLGPLYNASGRDMRTWKDALNVRRPLNGDPTDLRSLNMQNTVGLSFQANYGAYTATSVTVLAQNALVYRAAPSGFPLLRGLP